MNTDAIDKAFIELISQRGIYKKLGVADNLIQQYRSRLKNDLGISYEKKLELLQKSGWRQNDIKFTTKDLVDAVAFALRSSAAAKEHGAEYLVEKFLKSNK